MQPDPRMWLDDVGMMLDHDPGYRANTFQFVATIIAAIVSVAEFQCLRMLN